MGRDSGSCLVVVGDRSRGDPLGSCEGAGSVRITRVDGCGLHGRYRVRGIRGGRVGGVVVARSPSMLGE